jgi:hypothetical protein
MLISWTYPFKAMFNVWEISLPTTCHFWQFSKFSSRPYYSKLCHHTQDWPETCHIPYSTYFCWSKDPMSTTTFTTNKCPYSYSSFREGQANFFCPQKANSKILGHIPLSQIRIFLKCSSPQIAIFTKYSTILCLKIVLKVVFLSF